MDLRVPEEAVLVDARARRKGRSPPRRSVSVLARRPIARAKSSDLARVNDTERQPNAGQSRRNSGFETASRLQDNKGDGQSLEADDEVVHLCSPGLWWRIIVPDSSGRGCPMASVLHGAPARRRVFLSRAPSRRKRAPAPLAARYGLNAKTVRKWRGRTTTTDEPMGPKTPKSTVLTLRLEEAIVVAFRQKTLLPLDDVLGCLKGRHPQSHAAAPCTAACSAMASRGFQSRRHRSAARGSRVTRSVTSTSTVVNCDAQGKLVMFLAIDRVSKFTYVEFHDSAGKMEGSTFLKAVVEVFPYKIHTVLTDNGMAFADLPKNSRGPQPPLPRPAHLRPPLHGKRHRAPVNQALPPVDQRPG